VQLTQEELQALEQLPLTSDRLTRVRDVFVFSCYTGLAYADVSKLGSQHLQRINDMDWIILDRTKTKNQSVIPLLPHKFLKNKSIRQPQLDQDAHSRRDTEKIIKKRCSYWQVKKSVLLCAIQTSIQKK
jgi:hypothetical protein